MGIVWLQYGKDMGKVCERQFSSAKYTFFNPFRCRAVAMLSARIILEILGSKSFLECFVAILLSVDYMSKSGYLYVH